MLPEHVAETILRYGMFARGQRVGVAVSGGADSVCLLSVMRELAARWELALSILHVNHRLRGAASDGDEAFVRELGASLGLRVEVHTAEVAAIPDNLEQAGRRVRREFFLGFLRSGALERVALGHTRSDQAETVLFRFLRGSGTAGLAGMRPVTGEGFVRPLIEVERPEVEAYLRDNGIAWREDESNRDLGFARNRIRHELLPALGRENPALAATLAATARLAQDEEDYWEPLIATLAAGRLVERPPAVFLRAAELLELPRAVARRLLRRAVERVKGDLRGIDFPHIEQMLRLAELESGSGRFQAPGLDVFRSFEWLRLAPPGMEGLAERNYRLEVAVPGQYQVPGTRTRICLDVVEREGLPSETAKMREREYNMRESALDWGRISGRLELRNWRPGDQYRPVGHASQTKIKALFQHVRVPLWERRRWPVLVAGDSILWSARFGPAAEWAVTPRTQTLLRIREIGEIKEFL